MRCALYGIGGKHNGIMDFADNPFLNTIDKFGGGDFRCSAIHKPGISQSRLEIWSVKGSRVENLLNYIPTSRHRWTCRLIANRVTIQCVDLLNDLQHAVQ